MAHECRPCRWTRQISPVVALALVFLSLTGVRAARATPGAASWHRYTLLGENGTHYFRWAWTSAQPGSHYTCVRTMGLERVRKSDVRVVETIPLRAATYDANMDSAGVWRETVEPVPAFDLPGYLARHHVQPAFADDLFENRRFVIDAEGLWSLFEDGRVKLATRAELLRQIPELGEDARVVGIEETGFDSPVASQKKVYLRVWSNTAAMDVDWAEDLLMLDGEPIH